MPKEDKALHKLEKEINIAQNFFDLHGEIKGAEVYDRLLDSVDCSEKELLAMLNKWHRTGIVSLKFEDNRNKPSRINEGQLKTHLERLETQYNRLILRDMQHNQIKISWNAGIATVLLAIAAILQATISITTNGIPWTSMLWLGAIVIFMAGAAATLLLNLARTKPA